MPELKSKILELTDAELRKLLGIGSKEIIPMLAHNYIDPVLLSLLKKAMAALEPQSKDDAKERISG